MANKYILNPDGTVLNLETNTKINLDKDPPPALDYKSEPLDAITKSGGSVNLGSLGTSDPSKVNDIIEEIDKISSFGWDVHVADGHNYDDLEKLLTSNINGVPRCIVAKTKKGKGVSFMETFEWHAKAPNKDQYESAVKELLK